MSPRGGPWPNCSGGIAARNTRAQSRSILEGTHNLFIAVFAGACLPVTSEPGSKPTDPELWTTSTPSNASPSLQVSITTAQLAPGTAGGTFADAPSSDASIDPDEEGSRPLFRNRHPGHWIWQSTSELGNGGGKLLYSPRQGCCAASHNAFKAPICSYNLPTRLSPPVDVHASYAPSNAVLH